MEQIKSIFYKEIAYPYSNNQYGLAIIIMMQKKCLYFDSSSFYFVKSPSDNFNKQKWNIVSDLNDNKIAAIHEDELSAYFILFTNSNSGSIKLYKWNAGDYSNLLGNNYTISLQYVANDQPSATRVYDNQEITGTITNLSKLNMSYTTDLQLIPGSINGTKLTSRELNYKLSIPRSNNSSYGNRMRGKVLIVNVNYTGYDEFALYSILTKYRQSWI